MIRTTGEFVSFAPGRVNLIGEHTDYTGGMVFPMALDLGITVSGRPVVGRITATSSNQEGRVDLRLPVEDPTSVVPSWGRFLAAAANRVASGQGFEGSIDSSLPAGGTGLSTSTALTCAVLLALDDEADRMELARTAKAAEQAATGVETGIMDQLASLCGVDGAALMIDCHSLQMTPVPVPDGLEILIVHSGQQRELAESLYSERREACYAAELQIGPLRSATLEQVETLRDPVVRRRARHVVGDNGRVHAMADAFAAGDIARASEILTAGHRSYAEYFEASTPVVDSLVAHLVGRPGILAARLTGGGFGGSVVVFAEPGADPDVETWWTRARPSAGAHITWHDV